MTSPVAELFGAAFDIDWNTIQYNGKRTDPFVITQERSIQVGEQSVCFSL